MITIKCFGITKEIINDDKIELDLAKKSVSDLRKELRGKFKALNQIKGYMVAINHEYATDEQIIELGDEVAIIPPVSGG